MEIKNPTPVAVVAGATMMPLGHQTNFMETHTAQWFLHRGPTAKGPQAGTTTVRQDTVVLTGLGAQEGQMVQVDLGDQEVQEVLETRLVQVPELKR